mmetsp:Transcript_11282/g.26551  ORF Transcript_11282/g.26551 Transcript_11282/m.26551 type:complete len:245 (-) Transcript_11282:267-1001(-)
MREMDTSNRGFLTNDKVYALLEEQVKLQKTLVTQRKLLVGLCAFAVILALANMGTAFAAANLSKDTTTDSANNLVNKQTNEIMATKAKGSVYDITSGTGEDGRRLGPTSMLKSEAVALWADYTDGTPTVKVRYSCDGSSDVVHTMARKRASSTPTAVSSSSAATTATPAPSLAFHAQAQAQSPQMTVPVLVPTTWTTSGRAVHQMTSSTKEANSFVILLAISIVNSHNRRLSATIRVLDPMKKC